MTADTIAYLGSPGTYSYQAAISMFPDADYVGLRIFWRDHGNGRGPARTKPLSFRSKIRPAAASRTFTG